MVHILFLSLNSTQERNILFNLILHTLLLQVGTQESIANKSITLPMLEFIVLQYYHLILPSITLEQGREMSDKTRNE